MVVSSCEGACTDAGSSYCYECVSGFEWDGSVCCMSNAASGSTTTCSGDADCCSGHCSDYVPGAESAGGGPLAESDWHCCADGDYWNPDLNGPGVGGCVESDNCNPDPCPYDKDDDIPWWDTPGCLDQNQACCYTDKVSGDFTYDYLPNEMY